MRVFISWSKPRSRKVADFLCQWLKQLPLVIEVWISGEAIDPGTRWQKELADALKDTRFGILCLTPENQSEPWICFEGGAIAKEEAIHAIPYLIDMESTQVQQPLKQFQGVNADKEGTLKLIKTIHKASGDTSRSEADLEKAFERCWPELQEVVNKVRSEGVEDRPSQKDVGLPEVVSRLDRIEALVESLSSRFTQYIQCSVPGSQGYSPSGTGYVITGPQDWVVTGVAHSGEAGFKPGVAYGVVPITKRAAGYSGIPAVEWTDFKVELVGDEPRSSEFANRIRSLFNRTILGGTPTISSSGNNTVVRFSLPYPPADIQEVLTQLAQESGVQVLSIQRKAV